MVPSIQAQKIRVLLVDDISMNRMGIKAWLSGNDSIEVIGEAFDGIIGVKLAQALLPDLVLMDIRMPNMNGIEAARILKRESPSIKVLMMTMYDNPEYIREFQKSGVEGFVKKDVSPEELVVAIKRVHRGDTVVFYPIPQESNGQELTSREMEVLIHVAKGHSAGEIGKELCCSPRTVGTHKNKIMQKLDLHTVADLTRYAIAKGYVKSED